MKNYVNSNVKRQPITIKLQLMINKYLLKRNSHININRKALKYQKEMKNVKNADISKSYIEKAKL